MTEFKETELDERAIKMAKVLSADAVERAGHGHPGSPVSLAPIAYTLYQHFIKHDPNDPNWEGRDRFILSGGHASLTQYVQLYFSGYGLTLDDLKNFRGGADTRTPGHPEYGLTPGIEMTTGPLGQGFASAIGFAYGQRFQRGLLDPEAPEGESPFDHNIWVICGEGDIEEGISGEAASLAANQQLGNLTVIFDANRIQIEGDTEYDLTIGKNLTSTDGTKMGVSHKLHFKTLDQKGSTRIYMIMMVVMIVGMIFFSSRSAKKAMEKEKEEKLAEAAKGGYTAKLMRDLEAAHKEKLEKENRRYESEMASVNPNKAATSLVEELKAKHEEIVRVEELHFKKKAEEIKNNDPSVLITKDYADKIRVAKRERLINEIQMIFQDPIASLDPRMTVRDIIAEGLIIKGIKDKKYIDEQVYEYLEKVGLVREHAGRYPHEFSGGQRQRIGIARAMIMRPELIIADEPISALDVSIQAQVINLLNDLREELGLTILFIAHDLSVVKYFSDRIGVMYYGNMVEMADSEELFAHPMHPYTKSLLSAIPLPDPNYERRRVRVPYNAVQAHDYRFDKPSFREIAPGHWVKANDAEFEKMKKEYVEQSKK